MWSVSMSRSDPQRQYVVLHQLAAGKGAARRSLLRKEDRYGFKLTMGSGSGDGPRIFYHPLHQGQPDDVVLRALGVSQGEWLDHLAGVPQGQDSPSGAPVSSPSRHRLAGCPLDSSCRPVACRHQASPGSAAVAPLSDHRPFAPGPTLCGASVFRASPRQSVGVDGLLTVPAGWGPTPYSDLGVASDRGWQVTMTLDLVRSPG